MNSAAQGSHEASPPVLEGSASTGTGHGPFPLMAVIGFTLALACLVFWVGFAVALATWPEFPWHAARASNQMGRSMPLPLALPGLSMLLSVIGRSVSRTTGRGGGLARTGVMMGGLSLLTAFISFYICYRITNG